MVSCFGGVLVGLKEKINSRFVLSWREFTVIALSVGVIMLTWSLPPIAQDPAYHDFADSRRVAGITNFWNVISNLPFLAVGVWGLLSSRRCRPDLVPIVIVFSLGAVLICLGSSWYHLAPINETLTWDRLTMTVSFMAFFAYTLVMVTGSARTRYALSPLLIAGVASVIYWDISEAAGQGDLRPYALVQFMPGLLIIFFLLLYPQKFPARRTLWLVIAAYTVAKLLEWQDRFIYDSLLPLSGHTLKHIAAAVGAYYGVRVMLASSGDNQPSSQSYRDSSVPET
ncbi:MAG: alkaline phytoceramidase [Chromatiales bacterium]|jgi:hypothetical protein|nr:alkaline phytoceramidase [Chromatiales bacterium]